MPMNDREKPRAKIRRDAVGAKGKRTQQRTLLAAMSLLSASLGVTAAAERPRHPEGSSRLAQNAASESNQYKEKSIPSGPPNKIQSNQEKWKSEPRRPQTKIQSNQYKIKHLPPEPPQPGVKSD